MGLVKIVKIVKIINNSIRLIFYKRIFNFQYYYYLGNVDELYLSDDVGDRKYD